MYITRYKIIYRRLSQLTAAIVMIFTLLLPALSSADMCKSLFDKKGSSQQITTAKAYNKKLMQLKLRIIKSKRVLKNNEKATDSYKVAENALASSVEQLNGLLQTHLLKNGFSARVEEITDNRALTLAKSNEKRAVVVVEMTSRKIPILPETNAGYAFLHSEVSKLLKANNKHSISVVFDFWNLKEGGSYSQKNKRVYFNSIPELLSNFKSVVVHELDHADKLIKEHAGFKHSYMATYRMFETPAGESSAFHASEISAHLKGIEETLSEYNKLSLQAERDASANTIAMYEADKLYYRLGEEEKKLRKFTSQAMNINEQIVDKINFSKPHTMNEVIQYKDAHGVNAKTFQMDGFIVLNAEGGSIVMPSWALKMGGLIPIEHRILDYLLTSSAAFRMDLKGLDSLF